MWHHHGSDMATSPRAILLHTDIFFYTFLHTTVCNNRLSTFLILLNPQSLWLNKKFRNPYLPYLSDTWPQNAELNIIPMKTTVVRKACLYWLTPHSQCRAGDKILRIITSMESAIQQRPVTKLRMIWNLPKPRALTAWETVKESSGTTPEAAADIWISAPGKEI